MTEGSLDQDWRHSGGTRPLPEPRPKSISALRSDPARAGYIEPLPSQNGLV
jgi:hypothetical protein